MFKATFSWRTGKHPKPERKILEKLIERAAIHAGLAPEFDCMLSVLFVGNRTMAAANAACVGHEGTTDVITFSYLDDPDSCFAGDCGVELLVCTDVAAKEGAARPDSSYGRELALYVAHGFLHAAGEDDLTEKAAASMRRREKEVMTELEKEFDLDEVFHER